MSAPSIISPAPWVLIVEDDLDIRDTIVDVLGARGVAVAAAGNGLEALAYLRSASTLPRLILLDLMMPGMDGREFRLEQVKVPAWREVPVILMTAHGDAELEVTRMGIAGAIRKPFTLPELFALIAPYRPPGAADPMVRLKQRSGT